MLSGPSGKGRKRQKKGEKGRFRPISRTGGQTPLKPPFVTPPFAALQLMGLSSRVRKKGSFGKRVFSEKEKKHFLEILGTLEIAESVARKGESDPSLEILENLEILEIPPAKGPLFVMAKSRSHRPKVRVTAGQTPRI